MYVTYIERCRRNVRSMWFNVHWKTLYTQEEIWALRSPQHCCWGRATVQYKRTNDPTNERTNIYVYNFIGFYSANEHNQLITFAFFSCVVIAFSANWSLSHTVSLTFETIYYHGEKHTDWNQKKKNNPYFSLLFWFWIVFVFMCVFVLLDQLWHLVNVWRNYRASFPRTILQRVGFHMYVYRISF